MTDRNKPQTNYSRVVVNLFYAKSRVKLLEEMGITRLEVCYSCSVVTYSGTIVCAKEFQMFVGNCGQEIL